MQGASNKKLGAGFRDNSGDIFAYRDPTNQYREIELNFDNVSKRLAGVYLYSKDVTGPETKRSLTRRAKKSKKPDGSRLYTCEDSRVALLLLAPDGVVKKLTFWVRRIAARCGPPQRLSTPAHHKRNCYGDTKNEPSGCT